MQLLMLWCPKPTDDLAANATNGTAAFNPRPLRGVTTVSSRTVQPTLTAERDTTRATHATQTIRAARAADATRAAGAAHATNATRAARAARKPRLRTRLLRTLQPNRVGLEPTGLGVTPLSPRG